MISDRIWRAGATADELAKIEALDKEMAALRERSAAISFERQRIANRACQRARYQRRKNHETKEKIC